MTGRRRRSRSSFDDGKWKYWEIERWKNLGKATGDKMLLRAVDCRGRRLSNCGVQPPSPRPPPKIQFHSDDIQMSHHGTINFDAAAAAAAAASPLHYEANYS